MVKSGEGGKGLRFFRGRYKNAGRTKPAARGRLARGWNRDEGTGGFHVSRRGGGWKGGRKEGGVRIIIRWKEGRKGGREWMARHQRTPPRKRYAAAPLHLRRTVPHLTLSPREGVPDAWLHRTEGL